MSEKIIVPVLGESINEATVSKWLKNEGEEVFKGEPIVEIETDKVTQELYSEHDGVLEKVFFKEEEDVKIGDVIAKVNITETTRKTIS